MFRKTFLILSAILLCASMPITTDASSGITVKLKASERAHAADAGRPHPAYAPEYALTIHTSPISAKVKILNIGPRYHAGMLLKSDRYHVEVSAAGYRKKRQWIVLANDDLEKTITLEKAAPKHNTVAGIEMVSIPGGSFQMGSNVQMGSNDYDSEKPVHSVHVNSFKMGKYEVTQSQWQSVMGSNWSGFKGDNRPVEVVSWNDIQTFIRKLNSQTGKHFRLPSEAEWEYAARAGSNTKYSWGDSVGSNRANCDGCGSQWDNSKTSPVGSFSPNRFGLYDMHGNVWEWVQDCHYYYNSGYNGAPTNGSAWTSDSCSDRVLRGGSWGDRPKFMRSAFRTWNDPGDRNSSFGFRLVLD